MTSRFLTRLSGLGATLLLAACGGGGGGDAPPPPAANKPTAVATADRTSVDAGTTITLNGSASSTPNGGTLAYQWTLAGRPDNSQATLSDAATATPTFVADLPGTYAADLVVRDGVTASDPARVSVTAVNRDPVAITPLRHSVRLGTATLGLDGTASLLPHGATGTLSYLWTLQSKPDNSVAAIRDYDKGNATLELDLEGEYHVRLVVSHDGKDSAPADVVVTVSSGNAQPVAEAQDVTVKLGQTVRLDGSASYDPDGQPLQFRWAFDGIAGRPLYAPEPALTDGSKAVASFTPVAAGTYKLRLTVFDGVWRSAPKAVTVTVEKPADPARNLPPVGRLVGTGYYPSSSVGEQEIGGRADFMFYGYDPEGEPLQLKSAALVEKPAGSAAELVEHIYPLGRTIFKIDVAGTYKVRMTFSDGVHDVTHDATLVGKIGVNNRPLTGSVRPASASVLAGGDLLFQTSNPQDPDGDPLTYHWELVDKPDGSQATLVAERDGSNEYRRARVKTDRPGPYAVRLVVEDDRGLKSMDDVRPSGYAEAVAMAKAANNPPVMHEVRLGFGGNPRIDEVYELLTGMRTWFKPVVVDPDGDELYIREQVVDQPAGGTWGADPNYQGGRQMFSLPGRYVIRFEASDGIADLPPYDVTVNVVDKDQAKGVRMERLWEVQGQPTKSQGFFPWPFLQVAKGGGTTVRRTEALRFDMPFLLKAMDGDYTIVDVKAEHLNGPFQPELKGLSEGLVIRRGDTVRVEMMMPPLPCGERTADQREWFRWSFRVKEDPKLTFLWETSLDTQYNSNHPACAAP